MVVLMVPTIERKPLGFSNFSSACDCFAFGVFRAIRLASIPILPDLRRPSAGCERREVPKGKVDAFLLFRNCRAGKIARAEPGVFAEPLKVFLLRFLSRDAEPDDEFRTLPTRRFVGDFRDVG